MKKYWLLINRACLIATFLFSFLLITAGPTTTIQYDEERFQRVEGASQIETLRKECREIGSLIKFAQGANINFTRILLLFIFLVFSTCSINLILIRDMEKVNREDKHE